MGIPALNASTTASRYLATISVYLPQWKAEFSMFNGRYGVFHSFIYSLYSSWRHRKTSTDKVGLSAKVKQLSKEALGTASLPHALEMEMREMAYGCVHSSACHKCSVQKFIFRPVELGDVSHTSDSSTLLNLRTWAVTLASIIRVPSHILQLSIIQILSVRINM